MANPLNNVTSGTSTVTITTTTTTPTLRLLPDVAVNVPASEGPRSALRSRDNRVEGAPRPRVQFGREVQVHEIEARPNAPQDSEDTRYRERNITPVLRLAQESGAISSAAGASQPEQSTTTRGTRRRRNSQAEQRRVRQRVSAPAVSTPSSVASQPVARPPVVTARSPAALGITTVPNALGIHLEAQQPGAGSCPAHSVNHMLQATVVAPSDMNNDTLDNTARTVGRLGGGVNMLYHVGQYLQADPQLEQHLQQVGTAVFELGDVNVLGGGAHQITMVHRSGRGAGPGGTNTNGTWAVLESGMPRFSVPAHIQVFATPGAALQHVANLNATYNNGVPILNMAYPAARLQTPQGAQGAYVGMEGFVLNQQMTPAERSFLRALNTSHAPSSSSASPASTASTVSSAPTISPGPAADDTSSTQQAESSRGRRRNATAQPLPLELAAIRQALPRRDNESNIGYARRLYLAALQGDVRALIDGRLPTMRQLADLTGAAMDQLYVEPALRPLTPQLLADLLPIWMQMPRRDGESNIAYARRVHLAALQGDPRALIGGQTVPTLEQLSQLSGTPAYYLRNDPCFQDLTPEQARELVPIWLALPRHEGEAGIAYARRIFIEAQLGNPNALINGQPPSLQQLALLSLTPYSSLRADPTLVTLTPEQLQELTPIWQAVPRREDEPNIGYARRVRDTILQREGRRLGADLLALLSGAPARQIQADPAFATHSTQLAQQLDRIAQALPRFERESNIAYARRLHFESQQGNPLAQINGSHLTLDHLSALSGAATNSLRADPSFRTLSNREIQEFLPIWQAFPRGDRETNIAYARRLHNESQQGNPLAQIAGQPLTISHLSSLSGCPMYQLRANSAFRTVPADERQALAAVQQAFPRTPGETNMAYARRLHEASQGGDTRAWIAGRPLSIDQLADLSGAKVADLRLDPAFLPFPPELLPVRQALPRQQGMANLAYARYLHDLSQSGDPRAQVNGRPLNPRQLAALSGAPERTIRHDPHFHVLPAELVPVQRAFPRSPAMSNIGYARLLHAASQRGDPDARVGGEPLSMQQLALLSRSNASNLRRLLQ